MSSGSDHSFVHFYALARWGQLFAHLRPASQLGLPFHLPRFHADGIIGLEFYFQAHPGGGDRFETD